MKRYITFTADPVTMYVIHSDEIPGPKVPSTSRSIGEVMDMLGLDGWVCAHIHTGVSTLVVMEKDEPATVRNEHAKLIVESGKVILSFGVPYHTFATPEGVDETHMRNTLTQDGFFEEPVEKEGNRLVYRFYRPITD